MKDFFSSYGFMSGGMLHLSGKEALACCSKGALLLDVRDQYELEARQFDVPEVLWVPFIELPGQLEKIPNNRPLIVADSVGLRSKETVRMLLQNGFIEVANLAGGIFDWERDKLPLKLDKGAYLHAPCACMIHQKKSP